MPIIFAVVGAVSTPRPLVIAADNGRLMAVRDTFGDIWLSHTRREKFVAESWLEREAARNDHQAAGDWRAAEEAGVLNCDSRACLLTAENGKRVSIVKAAEAVTADCGQVDLFIAPETRLHDNLCPLKDSRMIDTYDLRYRGAHSVYVTKGGFRVRSVSRERGLRPWVPRIPPRPTDKVKTL